MFNHESPRCGETFVTRKIGRAIPRLIKGDQKYLYLGNTDARRNWGHARDYMRAVHMILELAKLDDFVFGIGESYSVREFVEKAFSFASLGPKEFVRFDLRYLRPKEVDHLQADVRKTKSVLGWEPNISFNDLAREMVDAELRE
jgi:GDPmannose 4,6-dehydratase